MLGSEYETMRSLMSLLEQTPTEDLKALVNNEQQLADMVTDFKKGNGGPYGVGSFLFLFKICFTY